MQPQPSTSSADVADAVFYEFLPPMLIEKIAGDLSVDDRLNFMSSSPHVDRSIRHTFRRFRYMQVSDQPAESHICEDEGSERYGFDPAHLQQLLDVCIGLSSVGIVTRPSGNMQAFPPAGAASCPLFATNLYLPGGYIGRFLALAPPQLWTSLESLNLTVDLTVESFSQLALPCPVEDLAFAARFLAEAPFSTSIQIGFGSDSPYTAADNVNICGVLGGMHHIQARMKALGWDATIDPGDGTDGYIDLTVEKGRVEYSFSLFYYNPAICDPSGSYASDNDDVVVDRSAVAKHSDVRSALVNAPDDLLCDES
ncbi:Protein K10D6.4 a [Aphelenchoides avenae]|nr:Protein K10D6.4 a [Aphelenchus avenae]